MEISWREAGSDAQYRMLDHRRVQNEAHTGNGCEWLRISANGGSYIYIAHDVGRPAVIDELMPSLWVKSDRSAVQMLARIVLPRTIDSKTGKPVTTLVAGTSYTDTGRWQELRITDMPRLLERQIRFLHGRLGPNVDGREAYVDAVLLNVYGGPGVTNVWIDDLDVSGYVSMSAPAQAQVVKPLPPVGKPPLRKAAAGPLNPAECPLRPLPWPLEIQQATLPPALPSVQIKISPMALPCVHCRLFPANPSGTRSSFRVRCSRSMAGPFFSGQSNTKASRWRS